MSSSNKITKSDPTPSDKIGNWSIQKFILTFSSPLRKVSTSALDPYPDLFSYDTYLMDLGPFCTAVVEDWHQLMFIYLYFLWIGIERVHFNSISSIILVILTWSIKIIWCVVNSKYIDTLLPRKELFYSRSLKLTVAPPYPLSKIRTIEQKQVCNHLLYFANWNWTK